MDYDVIVIGSGQAGVPLAARLAGSGRSVLLAERGSLGGTCVNTGCTPTKTMVASARAAHAARAARRLGVHAGNVRVDLAEVVARKDEMVRTWQEGVRRRMEAAGDRLRLLRGHARFLDRRSVEVAGERHRAETIVVNVGARPATPDVPGLAGSAWLDNRRLMELTHLPGHLLVLGGGYVGCELAQAFRRFGAAVTIIDPGVRLLAREEDEASEAIEGVFREEGIQLRLGARPEAVAADAHGAVVRLAGGAIEGTHLLVAAGRRPNTDDLGADRAGVRLDDRGFIEVDEHYRTSAPGVYAVGDCAGGPQFTHAAWDDHRILFDVLQGRPRRARGDRLIPSVVYTDPQVARVGITVREARAAGLPCEVATMPFGRIARAVETGETAGVVKVLVDPSTELLRGSSIVGAEAGELIHAVAALMQAGATARTLVDMEMAHPAFAEGLQSAVMEMERFALT